MIEYLERDYNSFQNVWLGVIVQALDDLQGRHRPKTKVKIAFYKSVKGTAERWFRLRNEEFQEVCKFANIDPFFILRMKEKVINDKTIKLRLHLIK